MWIVAGVLLGIVVLGALVGFHAGPHAHIAAGVVGLLAAGWLALMAADGRSGATLWLLFGADLAISAGMSVMAWVALAHRDRSPGPLALGVHEGTQGVAVTDLTPSGVVRVGAEEWSATSANGTVRAGSPVQVLRAGRVRLEVWGEEPENPLGTALDRPRSHTTGTEGAAGVNGAQGAARREQDT